VKRILLFLLFVNCLVIAKAQIITTIAGTGTPTDTGDGGLATAASVNEPFVCRFDAHGNLYFTEVGGNRVRKINPFGIISTVAGGGSVLGDGGPATAGQLSDPDGIAIDLAGNIYIADEYNNRVRKVDAVSGIITTIAGNGSPGYGGDDGPSTASVLHSPNNVCVDGIGDIYILDGSNRIRKINASGIITTFAGNGTPGYTGDGGLATAAEIGGRGICSDVAGNVYFTQSNHIRKIDATGIITTIAGTGGTTGGDGGPASAAGIEAYEIQFDHLGNLYVSGYVQNVIRKIDVSGIIHTVAGDGTAAYGGDGFPATAAQLHTPIGIAFDSCNNLYIADRDDNHIRKVTFTPSCGIAPTVAISGPTSVCAGAITTLSGSSAGGTWSSDAMGVATVGSNTGIVTGEAGGSAVITYTLGSAMATATVTVHPLPVAGSITGSTSVCVGAAIALSESVAGGVWSTGSAGIAAVGSAGVVSGLSVGSALISYSVTNSCGTASDTATVVVNPLPVAGTISGTLSVCAGSTTSLSDGIAGGVWSSGGLGFATVSSTGVVTDVAAGTSLMSYSVTNSCGTAVATATVTVNPLPVAGSITGTLSVCTGASTSLGATVAGGSWSSSVGATTVSSTGVVTGVAAGTSIISYSVTNSCGTAVATTTVTVNPLPDAGSITGSAFVCVGSSITLIDGVSGGTWSSASGAATLSSAGVVSGVAAGIATISYSITNSCGAAVATTTVTVYPLPAAGTISGMDSVCVGNTSKLSETTMGGVWSSVYPAVASVNSSGVVIGVITGVDTIEYTVTDSDHGCSAWAVFPFAVRPFTECNEGVAAPGRSKGEVTLFPNPNDGSFVLSVPAIATEPAHVTITNMVGKKVNEFVTGANANIPMKLNVPAGVYFISVATPSGVYNAKLVFKP